jgi:hypothetical protein
MRRRRIVSALVIAALSLLFVSLDAQNEADELRAVERARLRSLVEADVETARSDKLPLANWITSLGNLRRSRSVDTVTGPSSVIVPRHRPFSVGNGSPLEAFGIRTYTRNGTAAGKLCGPKRRSSNSWIACSADVIRLQFPRISPSNFSQIPVPVPKSQIPNPKIQIRRYGLGAVRRGARLLRLKRSTPRERIGWLSVHL